MGDRTTGLIEKYNVERTDGKPITHGCIVLEWTDPNARVGIKAFADAVRADGYEVLADDLDRTLDAWGGPAVSAGGDVVTAGALCATHNRPMLVGEWDGLWCGFSVPELGVSEDYGCAF